MQLNWIHIDTRPDNRIAMRGRYIISGTSINREAAVVTLRSRIN